MNVNEIKKINEEKLNYYKKLKEQDQNKNNLDIKIEIHTKLKEILENNETIFFEISMDEALQILSQLFPKEQIKSVYKDLISQNNYIDLKKRFKL